RAARAAWRAWRRRWDVRGRGWLGAWAWRGLPAGGGVLGGSIAPRGQLVTPLLPPPGQTGGGGGTVSGNERGSRRQASPRGLHRELPPPGGTTAAVLSARTKIFLYVKLLPSLTGSYQSLFSALLNKKDVRTDAIYSRFKLRNSSLPPSTV